MVMDPLSISASVAGLTASCVQTAKTLRDLKDKFDNANLTISAICTETTLISASMSHIQSCMLQSPDAVSAKLQSQPSLESTLDQALTGCYVVFDNLESEVSKLTESEVQQNAVELKFTSKLRYMWSESTMKELLAQMRGLQTALTLVIQLLGAGTMTELKQVMDQNTAILNEVAQHTSRISSSANKTSRAPKSIYDVSFKTFSVSEDEASLYSSKLFAFDDEVVNSTAYRQVLAKAYGLDSSTGAKITNDVTGVKIEETDSQNTETQNLSDSSTPTASVLDIGEGGKPNSEKPTTTSLSSFTPLAIDPVKEFLRKRKFSEWVEYWPEKPDLSAVPKKEICRQNLLHEIIATEANFLRNVQLVHCLYYYRLALAPFTVVSSGSNQVFAEKTFGCHQPFYHLHKRFLYDPLVKRQEAQKPWLTHFADIFQGWLEEAAPIYMDFCALYPHLNSAIKVEAAKNTRFKSFLNDTREHKLSSRLSWDTYLKAPINRLSSYALLLSHYLSESERADERHGYHATERVVQGIHDLVRKCGAEISKAQNEVEVKALCAQIKSPLSEGISSSESEIIFDEILSYKAGFRKYAQYRLVVLASSVRPMILVLAKAAKQMQIVNDTDSYELGWQIDLQPPRKLHLTSSAVLNQQVVLTFSQDGDEPRTLCITSIESVAELLDAVKAIGGEVEDLGTVNSMPEAMRYTGRGRQ